MSNLHDHAVYELSLLDDGSDEQKEVNKDILEIVDKFASQGHSGFSAYYALSLVDRLLKFLPIKPLTGEDSEWNQLNYGGKVEYQNKRASNVFKDSNGNVYDVDRFSHSYGDHESTWCGPRYYIDKFPYQPVGDSINIVMPIEFYAEDAPLPTAEQYAEHVDDPELKKHILNKF